MWLHNAAAPMPPSPPSTCYNRLRVCYLVPGALGRCIQVPGGKQAFYCHLDGLNGDGEPAIGVYCQSTSMHEAELLFRKCKEDIDVTGGTVSACHSGVLLLVSVASSTSADGKRMLL